MPHNSFEFQQNLNKARGPRSDSVAERIKRLKLRHLKCVIDVARLGSVRAVAEAQSVTESAVSKTLRELETQLGTKLFERAKRGMSLTESGRRFATYASSAISAIHAGVTLAGGESASPTVVVRVGAMAVVAATLMPDVIHRYLDDDQDNVVEIEIGSQSLLLERLRSGSVDLVVGRLPHLRDLAGLDWEQLYIDTHVFVVRAGHPLSNLERPNLTRVASYAFVLPTRQTAICQELDRFLRAHRVRLRGPQVEIVDVNFSRHYTLISDAVWFVSSRAVAADLKLGTLKRVDLAAPTFEAPIGLITRRASVEDPSLLRLIALIRGASGNPVVQG